jgi:cytochrome c biogenesis protein CcdA
MSAQTNSDGSLESFLKNKINSTKKYILIIILILFLSGCLEGSQYLEAAVSELKSAPEAFSGKQVCIDGVLDDNKISGILIENITGIPRNGTLATVCGTFMHDRIRTEIIDPILTISTEKDVFRSNEIMNVHVEFNSTKEGRGQLRVSGIKNFFGRAFINETREVAFRKGENLFDFVFRTPSCEECSALSPGVYTVNATIYFGGRELETFKKVILERQEANVSATENVFIDAQEAGSAQKLVENADTKVRVDYFYDPGCLKCAKASPVIDDVVKSYGDRVIYTKYSVLTDRGVELARKYQLPGVPSIVVNEERVISYENYNGDTARLAELLKEAIDSASITAAGRVSTGKKIILSIPSVFIVGFLAGFNPCLLAILAFIASVTLATTGKRRNVLLIVMMFSLGIFVTYLVVGIGILRVIEQSTSLQASITKAVILLISLLGIWHIYDAYHLRKNTESSFYTPKAFIRLTESVTKKVSLPAAFVIGALVSLIKAPCVGAVYFVILDMVRSGDSAGILYLASYNLGVVFPVLIIGAGIAFGLDPEKVEKFRKERRSALRLITGVTLIIIAVLMYGGII